MPGAGGDLLVIDHRVKARFGMSPSCLPHPLPQVGAIDQGRQGLCVLFDVLGGTQNARPWDHDLTVPLGLTGDDRQASGLGIDERTRQALG